MNQKSTLVSSKTHVLPSLTGKIPDNKLKIDEYAKSLIQCHIRSKRVISYNSWMIVGKIQYKEKSPISKLVSLIMNSGTNCSVSKYVIERAQNLDFSDLFKPTLLTTFDHAKELIIMTTTHFGSPVFPFCLFSLLSLIKDSGLSRIVIRGAVSKRLKTLNRKIWFEEFWNEHCKDLIQQYQNENYKIRLLKAPNRTECSRNSCVIQEILIDRI